MWKAGWSQIGLNAAQNAWHNNPKRESCERREKNESEIRYLGFLCVLLQCMWKSERQAWQRGGGGGEKEEDSSLVKWDGSLRCRWQTIQAAAVEKRWGSEWHQAAGVNIIKQNAVNAELCMTECSSKMKGYTTCLVERSGVNAALHDVSVKESLKATKPKHVTTRTYQENLLYYWAL